MQRTFPISLIVLVLFYDIQSCGNGNISFDMIEDKVPEPPNPAWGPVPFEGVSPCLIDQSNWSSFFSFRHRQKPLSKEQIPGIVKDFKLFYIQRSNWEKDTKQ